MVFGDKNMCSRKGNIFNSGLRPAIFILTEDFFSTGQLLSHVLHVKKSLEQAHHFQPSSDNFITEVEPPQFGILAWKWRPNG